MDRSYKVQDYAQPQRKIKPTRRSVSGVYPFRGEESVEFESTLERDFLIRTEINKRVIGVVAQPVQLPFTAPSGCSYTYTPDFLVVFRAGPPLYGPYYAPQLIEVKYRSDLKAQWRKLKPKFRAAMRYAREQGYEFRVMDEFRIRDQVFQNAQHLQRYKKLQFPPEETAWLLETVRNMGVVTFDYLLVRHFRSERDRAIGISHVWHLIATGQIECELDQPITLQTELWVPSDE